MSNLFIVHTGNQWQKQGHRIDRSGVYLTSNPPPPHFTEEETKAQRGTRLA